MNEAMKLDYHDYVGQIWNRIRNKLRVYFIEKNQSINTLLIILF